MLIDVHTHITDKAFDKDRDNVVKRSQCKIIIENGLSISNNREVLALADKYDNVYASLGLYPGEIVMMDEKDIEKEIDWIKSQNFVAIGEIGLDKTYPEFEKQQKYFKKLVQLAISKKIPVLVHSRKAEKEVIEILEELNAKKVLMHCFSGKLKLAERIEKNGWYFSIPPVIVHSTHFQEMIKRVSITKLLTETDAPYLGPDKEQRNEPKNVIFVIRKIAEIKGMDEKEVENSIYMNYQHLFRK
jgi:TatD DNase family protein